MTWGGVNDWIWANYHFKHYCSIWTPTFLLVYNVVNIWLILTQSLHCTHTNTHTTTTPSQSVYLLIFICSENQSCQRCGPQVWLQSEERAVSMATERPDLCTRADNQTAKRENRESAKRKKTKDEYLFMKVEEIEMPSSFQSNTAHEHTHTHTHTHTQMYTDAFTFTTPFRVKSADSFT